MSLQLPFGIRVLNQLPTEDKYLNNGIPYTGVTQANTLVPIGIRHTGLTLNIGGVEYWYSGGITNGSLVAKSFGGGTGTTTANNGLTKIGNTIVLGGTLTGNTIIDGPYGLTLGDTTLTSLTINTTDGGSLFTSQQLLNGNIQLNVGDGVNNLQFFMGASVGNMQVTSTGYAFAGIEYGGDYSANYTNRSLVDKEYVDSMGGTLSGSTSTYGSETWLGFGAGQNGSNANTVMLGIAAGQNATAADGAVLIGAAAGQNATNAVNTVFIGSNAGTDAVNTTQSVFIGNNVGNGATNAYHSTFIGINAGVSAINANDSTFIGISAGALASGATTSTFIGNNAGNNATNANLSTFIGTSAGQNATGATSAIFIGSGAGVNAAKAVNCIFIGSGAGSSDTIDNTLNDGNSILIGNALGSGGFKRTIIIGNDNSPVTNTMDGQFLIPVPYFNWQIRGIDYVMPSTQAAGAGYVLTNDGAGVLSWEASSGSSGSTYSGYISTGSLYTMTPDISFVGVSGSTGSTVDLPSTPIQFKPYTISDIAGNASLYNIIVDGSGYLIQGSTTALIDSNYGSITFVFNGYNWSITAVV